MNLIQQLTTNLTPFVIYGAQVVAYGAYRAILGLCGRKPECFVVSSLENNPKEIDGVPVRTPEAISKEWLVIVGVTELLQAEIIESLKEKGYQNFFALTQAEEHKLMVAYFQSEGLFPVANAKLEQQEKTKNSDEFVMYAVGNHRDKPLKNPPVLKDYEYPIQAGAALSEKRIATLLDNSGNNISDKNKQYCEMSAVYWIWKNTTQEWTGIEHYRRRLLVKPQMLKSDVDAILPLPYMCYPNTVTQFRRFVSEDVLQLLLKTLEVLHPEKYLKYREILYGQYQYTYNMTCTRREVFEDYCRWFFEITEHMETKAEQVPEIKNTRALSYVAEVLTNLYFMDNDKEWNILHVEKRIYT